MKLLLIFAVTWLPALGKKSADDDLSNGFRTEIDWVKWDKAIGVAKDLNKPIFFLIHKTWCGACKGLKREFTTAPKMPELIELSKKFVMVNVEDDDEPEDDKYAPDGGYIPRILFLDTDGEPLKTNNQAKYKNNKYFYPLVPQVLDGMQRALDEFEARTTKHDKKTVESEEKEDKKEKKETKEDKKKKETKEEKESEKKDKKEKKVEKKEDKKEKKEDKKEKKEDKKEKKDDKKEKKEDKKDKTEDKKKEKDDKKGKASEKKEDKKGKTDDSKKKKTEDTKKEDKKKKTEL
uniref:Thioredoxin domain-containing protein n=1 Tax=Haemonchus contortus TaxID=6289 RepID=A0A7I4Y4G3_HAECO